MTQLIATTPGLYPLPDWAKDELADRKGHQKDDLISGDEDEAVVAAYERARAEVVDRQREAGLDRVVEGQLRWDDMLAHPLCVHDSVETRGIVRYYDNNNFYREPVVAGQLEFDGDVAAELEAAPDATQAVLPGPYSLSRLATDEFYGDEAAFLDAVAGFLAGEAEAFPGVETLFLLEPSLVTEPPGDGGAGPMVQGEDDRDAAETGGWSPERASRAIDEVAGAVDAEVVVHTYWGAVPERTYAHLMDADVDAIGFDFVTDHERNLYNVQEYGTKDAIALGVVDGQNTLVESPEEIRERVEWVTDNVPAQAFDRVHVTANTELFYLPVSKAEAKLDALGRAASLEVAR